MPPVKAHGAAADAAAAGGATGDAAVRLEWSRVDLAANVIVLRGSDTKAGKSRLVPINEAAKDALLRRLQYRTKHCPDASVVFCGSDGKRMVAVKSSYRAACEASGLRGLRFHDLRHTCGSWLRFDPASPDCRPDS